MSPAIRPALDDLWRCLGDIPDPEIPVISLVELGIIRDVGWDEETLVVGVAPTYSGCPATSVIHLDIASALGAFGIDKLRIVQRLSPPWTTDWITQQGRDKLRAYGVAPPNRDSGSSNRLRARLGSLSGAVEKIACPRCESSATERISQFGSTPCKATYRCTACLEPFEYFKCI